MKTIKKIPPAIILVTSAFLLSIASCGKTESLNDEPINKTIEIPEPIETKAQITITITIQGNTYTFQGEVVKRKDIYEGEMYRYEGTLTINKGEPIYIEGWIPLNTKKFDGTIVDPDGNPVPISDELIDALLQIGEASIVMNLIIKNM